MSRVVIECETERRFARSIHGGADSAWPNSAQYMTGWQGPQEPDAGLCEPYEPTRFERLLDALGWPGAVALVLLCWLIARSMP